MIDVTRETVVSLVDVARRLGVTVQTVRNWATRQVGPTLETAKFGGKVVTSWEAINRFGLHRNAADTKRVRSSRTTPAGRSNHKRAEAYLKEIGLA